MAADINPRYKGLEVWGSTVGGVYTCKGVQISSTKPSINFGIWWDGDLSRELLDGTKLDKWDPNTNTVSQLVTFSNYGALENNGTKANPGLTADILGDWREEVIYRSSDNTRLMVFTTVIPTSNRIYTLMHDPQYRVAVAWQNSAYNQPPHPGFYLGTGMAAPPTPNIQLALAGYTAIADTDIRIKNPGSVTVYPNPYTASFKILAKGDFTYVIYDQGGQVRESGKATATATAGANLPAGIYIVKIREANGERSFKVIRQ